LIWIRDVINLGYGIRDKYPESATLSDTDLKGKAFWTRKTYFLKIGYIKGHNLPTEHELIVLSLAVFAEMLCARLKVRGPQGNLNKHIFVPCSR
jgi:hypothetical protein